MPPPPAIPDWVVRLSGWVELWLLLVIGVALAYLWAELVATLARALWRHLRR